MKCFNFQESKEAQSLSLSILDLSLGSFLKLMKDPALSEVEIDEILRTLTILLQSSVQCKQ